MRFELYFLVENSICSFILFVKHKMILGFKDFVFLYNNIVSQCSFFFLYLTVIILFIFNDKINFKLKIYLFNMINKFFIIIIFSFKDS